MKRAMPHKSGSVVRRRRVPRREKFALLAWPKGTFQEIMRGKRMIANSAGIEDIHGNQVQLLPDAANCFLTINRINPRAAAETAAGLVSAARAASAALRVRRGRPGFGRDDPPERILELRRVLGKLTRVGRHWLGRSKDEFGIAPGDRYEVAYENGSGSGSISRAVIRHGSCRICDTWKVRGMVVRREWEFLVAAANACLDVSTRNPLAVAECLPLVVKTCQRTVVAYRAHARATNRPLPNKARKGIESLEQQLKRTLTRIPEGD
jgi:hypothetical protein